MKPFAVTFDYRCPFARNVHEHLLAGLADGADWDVRFVWDDPAKFDDLVALAAGIVVRDQYPEQFAAVHYALFAARHDEGLDLRDRAVVARVLDAQGVPSEKVLAEVESGGPIDEIKRAYEEAVGKWSVFGVPTFIVDDSAVFVRLMTRPQGDGALARKSIEDVVRLIADQPDLNEFKYTTIGR
jgi:protein-disulfide isomerase-like protein with CxxC motif